MKKLVQSIVAWLMVGCMTNAYSEEVETPSVEGESEVETIVEPKMDSIVLGGGCFWCIEAACQRLEGVESAVSGYMGGHVKNPTYEQVCSKKSGHIEVVRVIFDANKISTESLLDWFWKMHDPTTKDRQGNDKGPQYASAVFYNSEQQQRVVEASIEANQQHFKDPIVTVVKKCETFYPAEAFHQDYYNLNKKTNSYCKYVITPKLQKLSLDK